MRCPPARAEPEFPQQGAALGLQQGTRHAPGEFKCSVGQPVLTPLGPRQIVLMLNRQRQVVTRRGRDGGARDEPEQGSDQPRRRERSQGVFLRLCLRRDYARNARILRFPKSV